MRKLFSFVLVALLLLSALVLASASPPTKVKQSAVASHVQPVVAIESATAPIQIKNSISYAVSGNVAVGAYTFLRKNEVAARARSGVKEAREGSFILTYMGRRGERDVGPLRE